MANQLQTENPPPGTLRARIMERRRNRYGEGPAVRYELTAEEWDREELPRLRRMAIQWQTEVKPQRVYFIQAASGPIKIGIAADVAERLKALQTGHYERLTLCAATTGGQAQEREYHKRFAAHRLHGEWFAPHPDILAEIDRLKEQSNA